MRHTNLLVEDNSANKTGNWVFLFCKVAEKGLSSEYQRDYIILLYPPYWEVLALCRVLKPLGWINVQKLPLYVNWFSCTSIFPERLHMLSTNTGSSFWITVLEPVHLMKFICTNMCMRWTIWVTCLKMVVVLFPFHKIYPIQKQSGCYLSSFMLEGHSIIWTGWSLSSLQERKMLSTVEWRLCISQCSSSLHALEVGYNEFFQCNNGFGCCPPLHQSCP